MFNPTDRFLVIDTETTNSMDDPLVYDCGFAVVDLDGHVYEQHSYVVAEIFYNDSYMQSAYYADKRNIYLNDIQRGTRKVRSFFEIWGIVRDTIKRHNISITLAHNATFDYRALNTTLRVLSCSRFRYFMPYNTEWWDTLRMSRAALNDNPEYELFCEYYEYYTSRGQKRFTAEIVYRFISDQPDFVESHTGLEDVLIEKEIFVYCAKAVPEFDGSAFTKKR